ncbi:hypothetical protein SAMN00017405_0032 [Desulfonispora thiosulfatigenes DSM 11270]|uniref:Uncharacterized protein n=1 Tax=Desulfonispora thiosulfatigenes DSM 11270 TaxID=656914 RepID=A0A1W1VK28_DESTI|nr:hypothetical protein [Desulfonispora thiosulfatigenes]SMB93421.1 hypothetical protein SAMN00017405_0032 [Desulfonispora thiosulfatigenes DSM 11270]
MFVFDSSGNILLLITLYMFLALLYLEIRKYNKDQMDFALLLVISDFKNDDTSYTKGEIILINKDRRLSFANQEITLKNGNLLLKVKDDFQTVSKGELVEFAGGSLQLVGCSNEGKIIDEYWLSEKG